MLKSFLCIVIVLFAATLSFGQSNDAEIAKQIDQLFSKYNSATPGVAIAVVKDGKVVFTKVTALPISSMMCRSLRRPFSR
jgi:hypothetical protein